MGIFDATARGFTTTPARCPSLEELRPRIEMALREDLGAAGDVTSAAIFPPEHHSRAYIHAKQRGVVCGLGVVQAVFAAVDRKVRVELNASDGEAVVPSRRVAHLSGPTRSILSGERTALNFLQRLSGVASLTRAFVDAAGGRTAVCDTRKTTPMFRDLEKWAVVCGGGTTHRLGLHDMVMIKDTHADGAGGLGEAIRRVRAKAPGLPLAAEARTLADVSAAMNLGVDLLMLDNMSMEQLRQSVALVAGRVPVEVTGGVRLDTIAQIAALGVDRVSVGALTHSFQALDFSLEIELGQSSPPAKGTP